VALASALTAGGVALAARGGAPAWAAGQVLIALATVQWFCLLHEAGHHALFASSAANRVAGHVAGCAALIPFRTWRLVHAGHHRWTGWQDRDATTAALAPRARGRLERALANAAWRSGFPLFSLAYRWNNFWNAHRVERFFAGEGARARNAALGLACVYAALALAVGPLVLARLVGVGLLLGLALQDPLILSQHTHLPMPCAAQREVRPLSAAQQARYTRSLAFPAWIGRGLLCGVGEHERHHAFPRVPGYLLHRVPWTPPRRVGAWRFLRAARRLSGARLLFENAETTGFRL
jgi:fatty acid desaturase